MRGAKCGGLDDDDRRYFLKLLGKCVDRFAWILTTYVLMSNHFHFVTQLTCDSLSRGSAAGTFFDPSSRIT